MYYFEKCRELFYSDMFRLDEKKEEKLQKQEVEKQYLKKLKPMKNRMLYFNN